ASLVPAPGPPRPAVWNRPETRCANPFWLSFDFDLAGLRLGRLGQPDREDAVRQLGVDLGGVGVGGQRGAVGELAVPVTKRLPRAVLADFPGDAQLVAAQLDVDVVALHPGQFGADDVAVVALLGLHRGYPPLASPGHAVPQLLKLAEWVPELAGPAAPALRRRAAGYGLIHLDHLQLGLPPSSLAHHGDVRRGRFRWTASMIGCQASLRPRPGPPTPGSSWPRPIGRRLRRGRGGCWSCRSVRLSSTGRTCRSTPTPGSPSPSRSAGAGRPGVGLAP